MVQDDCFHFIDAGLRLGKMFMDIDVETAETAHAIDVVWCERLE
ncbi:hypothetical protein [Neisseria zalophi]|nr:hypothetical protein [Neisseria zalophi]